MRRRGPRIFLDRVHHSRRVDERRPSIDSNGNTQRFGNLFVGCTVANGGFGMDRDTAVAARRNGDRERNKLADLRPEQILFLASRTGSTYPLIVSGLSWPTSFTPTASCLR
jgi:hypothetical protein